MKTFTQIINHNYTYYAFYLTVWLLIGLGCQCLYQTVIDAVAAVQVVPVVSPETPEDSLRTFCKAVGGPSAFVWCAIVCMIASPLTAGVVAITLIIVDNIDDPFLPVKEQIDSLPNTVQPDTLNAIYDTCVANEGLIWLIFMMCLVVYVMPIARETLKA